MTTAATTEPIRHAPMALWRIAGKFLGAIHALFGGPERVAFQHTLTSKAHAHLASWLRCAEAMLRRLIVIEAGAYPRPNTRPLLTPTRKHIRKLMSFTAEQPEKWRVSFRCFSTNRRRPAGIELQAKIEASSAAKPGEPVFVFREDRRPRDKARVSPRRAAKGAKRTARKRFLRQDRLWVQYEPKVRFRSAWPLAERYEALIRVFNDPTAYARRLARRLHATPHRLREALRAPADAEHRIDRFAELGDHAETAWRPHFSSG